MRDLERSEGSATSLVDDDLDAGTQLKRYLEAQAAIHGRNIRKTRRTEWAAAAVGIVCLLALLGAVLVTHAAYFRP